MLVSKLFNNLFSFLCFIQPLWLRASASGWHQANAWLAYLRVRFSFFAFTLSASLSDSGWPVLLLGVVWINGCFFRPFIQKSFSHLIARLGGVPGRDWISQRWCSRARFPGGASIPEVQTLERSRGTRQLRNWCKDAIEIPHTQLRTSCWCFSSERAGFRIVATWLILPVVICLS